MPENPEVMPQFPEPSIDELVEMLGIIKYLDSDPQEPGAYIPNLDPAVPFDGDTILCPICGFDYNHMGDAQRLLGNDSSDTKLGVRGDVTEIDMICEEGHEWQLCIGFHKGQLFMWALTAQHTTATMERR